MLRLVDPDEDDYAEEAVEELDPDEEPELEDEFELDEELELGDDGFELDDLDELDVPSRLSPVGLEGLFVAFTLQRWLGNCPRGPLEVGEPEAGNAIATLVCCWSATVTHGLAAEPRTLSELDEVVELLDFETLDEHVVVRRRLGLAELALRRRNRLQLHRDRSRRGEPGRL